MHIDNIPTYQYAQLSMHPKSKLYENPRDKLLCGVDVANAPTIMEKNSLQSLFRNADAKTGISENSIPSYQYAFYYYDLTSRLKQTDLHILALTSLGRNPTLTKMKILLGLGPTSKYSSLGVVHKLR